MTQLVRGWTKHLTPPVPGWQRTDPLDRGLVGEWRFDSPTGLMLPDYSGYGRRATIVGADWISTQYGQALLFGGIGSGDYAQVTNPPDLTNLGSLEVFCRCDDDVGLADQGYLVCNHNWAGDHRLYLYQRRFGSDEYAFRLGALAQTIIIDPVVGQWYHLVLTWDNGQAQAYANSNLIVSPAYGGDAESNEWLFGTDTIGVREYEGPIALVRAYNRVISAAEVRARYEICLKRARPLMHAWTMPWGMAPVAPPVGGHMTLWGRYWGP